MTITDVETVARERSPVTISPAARTRAADSHRSAVRISATRQVYGRTTGVGANRNVAIEERPENAIALLRSHATSAGPVRSPERIRAMLVVRLAQLGAGGSGADPALLDATASLLNGSEVPTVREHVGVGTADLGALATIALTLPHRFTPGDALAFLSSNAATIGDAALACAALQRLSDAGLVTAALSCCAVDGNAEAFAPVVDRATPFEGAVRVCGRMRALLPPITPRRIQDPFALRALPQVHGVFLDALHHLDEVITAMASAPSENPVIIDDSLAHHGAFHAAYLATALDTTRSTMAQAAQLSLARLSLLIEPDFTGLAPFLGDGTPGASGVMGLEFVSASALGTLRSLSAPAAVGSVTLSRGVEEDANFASQGARQALDGVAAYRTMVAAELVAAVRAIRQRGLDLDGPVADALDRCSALPAEDADRDLTGDLLIAADLLDDLARLTPSVGG